MVSKFLPGMIYTSVSIFKIVRCSGICSFDTSSTLGIGISSTSSTIGSTRLTSSSIKVSKLEVRTGCNTGIVSRGCHYKESSRADAPIKSILSIVCFTGLARS
jgi:hypothetical protein